MQMLLCGEGNHARRIYKEQQPKKDSCRIALYSVSEFNARGTPPNRNYMYKTNWPSDKISACNWSHTGTSSGHSLSTDNNVVNADGSSESLKAGGWMVSSRRRQTDRQFGSIYIPFSDPCHKARLTVDQGFGGVTCPALCGARYEVPW